MGAENLLDEQAIGGIAGQNERALSASRMHGGRAHQPLGKSIAHEVQIGPGTVRVMAPTRPAARFKHDGADALVRLARAIRIHAEVERRRAARVVAASRECASKCKRPNLHGATKVQRVIGCTTSRCT